MITKEDLKNYRKNQKYIEQNKIRIKEMLDSTEKITSSYSNMPRIQSSVNDKFAEILSDILDLERKSLEKIFEQEKKAFEVLQEIEKLEEKHRNILYAYYILGHELEQVAIDEGYSYRHTKRLRKEGLRQLKIVP